MVALFKDRSPATIIWLFILSIAVHSYFFVENPVINAAPRDGLLSTFLLDYVAALNPASILFIYHGVVILQALRLNYLFTDHRMYTRVNYLPAMGYILLTGVFTEWNTLTPALLTNFLVIWLFAKAIRLYNSQDPKTLLFNTGLVIGISVLLYHPSAVLIIVALFAVLILRPFQITEFLVLLMGLVFPYYFLTSYLYLTDRFATIKNYIPAWQLNLPPIQISPVFFATIALIVLILLFGLYHWQRESRRLIIQVRKNWTVLLVMLFVLLLVPFINKNAGIESLILWIVPASSFMGKGFLSPQKNTLPGLMFWSLLALSIIKNWHLIK